MKTVATAKANKLCIYCQKAVADTQDHVPPKLLFPKPRPGNLATVPCCNICNGRFEMDDEYFRLTLTSRLEVSSNREAVSANTTAIRGLDRAESEGFRFAFMSSIVAISPAGDPVREQDNSRVQATVTRIIKGLFYHQTGRPLPREYEANAFEVEDTPEMMPPQLYEVWETLKTCPQQDIRNMFSYRFYVMSANPNCSWWLMQFYESILFMGLTRRTEGKGRPLPSDAS